jgi:hypothetical protein
VDDRDQNLTVYKVRISVQSKQSFFYDKPKTEQEKLRHLVGMPKHVDNKSTF